MSQPPSQPPPQPQAQQQPPPQAPPSQYANHQRPFSPANSMGSPGTPQQYSAPAPKRQKLSPIPTSQPASPYTTSPYGMSPSTSTTASPHFSNVQLPANAYNTPYGNGHTNIQPSQPPPPPHLQQPPQYHTPLPPHPNHNHMGQQPNYNNYAPPLQTPGAMGPPLKPVDKPKDDVDMIDVLAGTGINLQEEEQYMFQISSSFGSGFQSSQSTNGSGPSFTQFPPGNEASFFGAGPANAAADAPSTQSQEEYIQKLAEKAWADAAYNLAVSQGSEFNGPFLSTNRLHQKMDDMSAKHGLRLNRVDRNMMGQFAQPRDFHSTRPTVAVQTATGPGMMMATVNGNFVPADVMLSDQVALISLACKHRLRLLLEEATKLGRGRQTGSHGIVPEEWTDVAVESNLAVANSVPEGEIRAGWESAVSPRNSNGLLSKEITPAPLLNGSKLSNGKLQASNEVVAALRTSATKERDLEERRLKKRQNRTAGGDNAAPRQSSAVPGTPGSVAPEPSEKAPTKKELKKKLESKASEAATHAAANVTTAQFIGGKSLFGKKKGGYSWLTGGTGSGASTPGRLNPGGLPTTPGGPVQPPPPERLTADPARRLGQWREDQTKGKGLQLRDWVAALEQDGHAKRSLQKAYLFLDNSEPK